MKPFLYAHALVVISLNLAFGAVAQGQAPSPSAVSVETLVFIRHGEKPPDDLGQLTCKGLNRALALPAVLTSKFGKPDYIFAPSPEGKIHKETSGGFYYVRPLATIEPTAIRLGMPVNTAFRYDAIAQLQLELTEKRYQKALIFVVWEHFELAKIARRLVEQFGEDPTQVPAWQAQDFDSIYVLRITNRGGASKIYFTHDHEGLDNLNVDCP